MRLRGVVGGPRSGVCEYAVARDTSGDDYMHSPLLVTVDEPRCHRADVCAGTDEQEDHEQE